jgi:hypothetical protein
MTEFVTEVRHHCRNPKCHSKLKTPVANPREAFCARGCHMSFYRKRCLVCEEPMERKTENQKICGKRKCRSAFRARSDFGRYLPPSSDKHPLRNPTKSGIKMPVAGDRGVDWAIAVNSARIRAPRCVLDAVFG